MSNVFRNYILFIIGTIINVIQEQSKTPKKRKLKKINKT